MQDCSIFGLGLFWCDSGSGRDRKRERERRIQRDGEEAQPETHDSLLRGHKLRCRTAEYAAWLLKPD